MREMKNSGVEWIGEIPSTWRVMPLKALFSFGKGLPITKENLEEAGVPVISYGQIHAKWNSGVTTHDNLLRYVNRSYLESNPQSLVQMGDFIMADTSEDREGCGNCAYIDVKDVLFAGYHTIILRSNYNADNKYLAYLFLTDSWRSQIRKSVSGVKLFSISRRILGSVSVLLPDNTKPIVDYLDSKCSQIDTLIQNVQKQIEKLKTYKQSLITEVVTKGLDPTVPMKDSGVEWIGEIPEKWQMRKANTLSERIVVGVVIRPSEYFDIKGTIPFLRGLNVKDYQISTENLVYITEQSNQLLSKSIVNEGDILIVRDGNIGASCIVPPELAGANVVSMIIFTPNSEITSPYICYCLNSLVGKHQFELTKIGSALTHTSVSAVSRLVFPLPAVVEQNSITAYLDKKCAQIDRLIAIKQAKIEKLEQYKRSLIYEYVTGKKEVS